MSMALKFTINLIILNFRALSSSTNTDVVLSYDADWGNPESHSPYIYDYFSETIRNRDTFSQEFRLVSQFLR